MLTIRIDLEDDVRDPLSGHVEEAGDLRLDEVGDGRDLAGTGDHLVVLLPVRQLEMQDAAVVWKSGCRNRGTRLGIDTGCLKSWRLGGKNRRG